METSAQMNQISENNYFLKSLNAKTDRSYCQNAWFPCLVLYHKIFWKKVGGSKVRGNKAFATVCMQLCPHKFCAFFGKKTKKFCACKDQRLPGSAGWYGRLDRAQAGNRRPRSASTFQECPRVQSSTHPFPDTRSLCLLTCMWASCGFAIGNRHWPGMGRHPLAEKSVVQKKRNVPQ